MMEQSKPKTLQEWATALIRELSKAWKNLVAAVRDFFLKPVRYHVVKNKKGPAKGKLRVVIARYSSKTRSYITYLTRRKYPNRKALLLG